MAAALIRIDQAAHPTVPVGTAGRSRDDIVAGSTVTLVNANNTGVRSWRWEIVDQPDVATPVTLSNPTAASPTFVPSATPGTYLIQLTVNEGRAGEVYRTIAAIRDSSGLRVPAAGEKSEANWDDASGNPNPRGWQPDVRLLLEQAAAGGGRQLIYTADFVQYGVDNGTTNLDLLGSGGTVEVNGVDWTVAAEGTYGLFEINATEGMVAEDLDNTRFQDGVESVISAAFLWVRLEDIPDFDITREQLFVALVDATDASADTEYCGIGLYCPEEDSGPDDETPPESVTADNSRAIWTSLGFMSGESGAARARDESATSGNRTRYGAGVAGANCVALRRNDSGQVDYFVATSVGGEPPLPSTFVYVGGRRHIATLEDEHLGDAHYIRLAVMVSEENLTDDFRGSVQRCWVYQG